MTEPSKRPLGKRRPLGLSAQIAASIGLVAVGAVLAVGFVSRLSLADAFDHYLSQSPAQSQMMPGRGMGRMMLGAAEQSFLSTVDTSVLIGALGAAAVAIVVAVLLARHFARPIQELEAAAESMATGVRSERVEPAGPAEVASLAEAFNRMADSLETSERLRRQLVADVAHELRNPIAAARVHAEGMAEGVLSVEPSRLEAIVTNLVHLTDLVNDLQELSVAEAGGLRYDMTELDIAALARSEASWAASIARQGVAIGSTGLEGGLLIQADERRMGQVLRNLLSNALRHTPSGEVQLSVTRRDDGMVEVSVNDSGEGIPDADLPHVFDRFYRADASRSADTGGSGLGLAIVKSIVEDHGGTVFARRSALGGAEVGFVVPGQ